MTCVKLYKRNGGIYRLVCDRHTDYGNSGEDIVCAALSSIVQTAALGVLQVAGVKAELIRRDDEGYFELVLPANMSEKQAHDSKVILDTLALGVSDLYSGFSDFIELEVI